MGILIRLLKFHVQVDLNCCLLDLYAVEMFCKGVPAIMQGG